MKKLRICIDSGHGDNSGCEYFGIKEDDYVWDIASILIHELIRWPIHVSLTRMNNQSMSLENRAAIASDNKADLYISLHLNANDNKAFKGGMPFYLPGDVIAQDIANSISMAQPRPLRRRQYTYVATQEQWPRVYNCLWRVNCPSVLYEMAFLSNKEDAQALKRDGIKLGLVAAIKAGIARMIDIDCEIEQNECVSQH